MIGLRLEKKGQPQGIAPLWLPFLQNIKQIMVHYLNDLVFIRCFPFVVLTPSFNKNIIKPR